MVVNALLALLSHQNTREQSSIVVFLLQMPSAAIEHMQHIRSVDGAVARRGYAERSRNGCLSSGLIHNTYLRDSDLLDR